MYELLVENKEWLFSGAGLIVLSIVTTFFINVYKKSEKGVSKKLFNIYNVLPDFILKRRFSEERLNRFLNVDLRPRDESAKLNLGELPTCQIWVSVVNHSPFNIEIESIKGEFNYNGCSINLGNREHLNISSHSTNDSVLLEGMLTDNQAEHCSQEREELHVSLIIKIRMRTSFGIYKKNTGHLQRFTVTVINRRK